MVNVFFHSVGVIYFVHGHIYIRYFLGVKCMYLILVSLADAILQYFLESASKDFTIGRVDQTQWHPDYCSPRVVVYILVKKNQRK